MSFGITNFDSLPDNVKLAFEDLDVWVSTFLLKEHNPDGTHSNIHVDSITAAAAQGLPGLPGMTGAPGSTVLVMDGANGRSPNNQPVQIVVEDSGHRWLRGPWLFDPPGNDIHIAGLRPAIITENKNNYLPQGFDSAVIIEVETDAPRTITGLQRFGRNKRLIVFGNKGNSTVTLAHNSSSSLYFNRMSLPGDVDIVLASGQYAWLYYDVGTEIWRCLITPMQSGGIGGGGGSGDVVGPASATDDRLAIFDGTTGKLIADGGYTIAGLIAAASSTGTQTANLTISNAQLDALFATPLTILAAPGAGKTTIVTSFAVRVSKAVNNWSSTASLRVRYSGIATDLCGAPALALTTVAAMELETVGLQQTFVINTALGAVDPVNTAVEVQISADVTQGGGGAATVYVTVEYFVHTSA